MNIEFKDNIPHITPETNEEEDILFGWYEKHKGIRMDCCMSLNWFECAEAEPTKREKASEILPLVSFRQSFRGNVLVDQNQNLGDENNEGES